MLIIYYKDLKSGIVWTTNEYIPPTCKRATLKYMSCTTLVDVLGIMYGVRSTSFRTNDNLLFTFTNTNKSMALDIPIECNISGSVKFDIVSIWDDIDTPTTAEIAAMGVLTFAIEYSL